MIALDRLLVGRTTSSASRGTARWMGAGEAWLRCRDSGKGAFRIGRSYRRDTWPFSLGLAKADGLSIGVVGDSGEGKGRSILVPNAATYDGPLLSIDVMGEQALTTALARARDHEVLVLDPMGVCAAWRKGKPLGLEGSINPLDMLDKDDPCVVDEIRALVRELIEDEPGQGGGDYWVPITRRFVAGVYGLMVAAGDGTLSGVLDIFSWPEDKREQFIQTKLCDFFWDNDLGDLVRDGGRAWAKQIPKGKVIIADTIEKNLGIFGSAPMRRVLQSGPLRFRDLKRRKISIYIVLPTSKVRSHGVWLRILADAAIRDLGDERAEPEVPALLMFDEFANLGKMQRVREAATYARGDGYRILWTIQAVSQLEDLYGNGWKTMFSQTGILILLGVQDQETLREISDSIGDTERWPKWYWTKLLFNLLKKDRHFALESETVPLARPEEIRDFCSLYGGKALA
ncbi:MAG: type IV secretory system conjugative DNA transfer family protein, partial [Alphaproteobacteria bacterium]|nr:type IV secretory system conjugative DNA transfer family protein [Alphaproteobacteria bacterium]